MCGRYLITSAPEAFRRLFGYPEQPNFPPRYNVAPTQPVPIVRLIDGKRQFALVRWGLIPPWVKDPRGFTLLINARGESVNEKPAFRNAMRRRRCLFPADGFYEWKSRAAAERPYCVRPKDGAPIAFAGLWESWMGPNGEEMETAAIVTTAANRELAPLHERMPVIVQPDAFDFWLDGRNVDAHHRCRGDRAGTGRAARSLRDFARGQPRRQRRAGTAGARCRRDYVAPAEAAPSAAQPAPTTGTTRGRRKRDDGQFSLF